MKKLLLFIGSFILCITLFAQAPQRLNYQSIIRDELGDLVVSSPVDVRISVLQGSTNGTSVYTETHTLNTNENGLATFAIGQGVTGDVFSNIDWSNGPYFIKTETAPEGGANYTIAGVSQFMSVPYALFAAKSGTTPGTAAGDMQYWDGTKWVMLAIGSNGQTLSVVNGLPLWTTGSGGTVSSGTIIKGTQNGDMLVWKDTSWVAIPAPTNAYGKSLVYCDGEPRWGGCLPKVKTKSPENVGTTTATLGAAVTEEGGLPVTVYGFIWGENKALTLSDSVVKLGAGLGDTKASFSKFKVNKTYYVMAFATNSSGTAFGEVVNFQTVVSNPKVQIVNSSKNGGSITISGLVADDGGSQIQVGKYGICYNTTGNPNNADNVVLGQYYFNGSFNVIISGLQNNTTYYFRAYAVNGANNSGYSQIITYKTPSVAIGENKFGGIVFYVDSTGEHGLVAAPSDQSTTVDSFYVDNLIFNNNILGAGNFAEEFFSGSPRYANNVELCSNLSLNGYNDWWLPNLVELEEMAKHATKLNLNQQIYISSLPKIYTDGYFGIPTGVDGIWEIKYNSWTNNYEEVLNLNYVYSDDMHLIFKGPFAIRAIRAF